MAQTCENDLAAIDADCSTAWPQAGDLAIRAQIASRLIKALFDAYYARSRAIPRFAQAAFEARDWQQSIELSRERISIFGHYRDRAASWLEAHGVAAIDDDAFWSALQQHFLTMIVGGYQGDVAFAFMQSVKRLMQRGRWNVVDYAYGKVSGAARPPASRRALIHRSIGFIGPVSAATIRDLLAVPGFAAPFRDLQADAGAVASRLNTLLAIDPDGQAWVEGEIKVVDAGFFRNRGAYLVGKIRHPNGALPLALALLNDEQGIFVDAVICDSDRLRYIFSSSLANFHVTTENFHELVDFLFELMPKRPRGMHYSTVGYNHVGKVAIMRQIGQEMAAQGSRFDFAPGPRGSVAIGFTGAKSRYVLKVVRNHPTDQYKWGKFAGIDAVLNKYRQVHEINRAGSMLDNVMYGNLALPRDFFGDALLAELLSAASDNVAESGDQVVFRHLIVQMRMVPLPEFLKTATLEQAEQAILSLGRCIKNNAAANVFNRDLDGRNYGVGQSLKVYLFDYDAVERLTDIAVRSNADRIDGEEDLPDWVFEDGIVFLPEEIELHLRIDDRHLRRLFRTRHGEILTPEYWLDMQNQLRLGQVPSVSTYPDSCRL